jgi:hypothetical protein
MQNLADYKKKIASRFIAIEGVDAANDLPESDEYHYAEKIDGNLGIAVVNAEGVSFYNRSGTLLSLPNLEANFPKTAIGIWAGELYINKERSHFYEVASAIANNKDAIHFAVFDAVHALDSPILERIKIVKEGIADAPFIHPVHWVKTNSKKELIEAYKTMVDGGKEGIVFHNSQGSTFKVKPSLTLDLAVVGYSMKEDGSGLRALLVGVYYNDSWLVVASVGGGFSDEDRVKWLSKLENIETKADFVMIANNRMAYKWVKPKIVVQVKCIEILNEDSSGSIYKDTLKYDADNGYISNGKVPGVSILSPVFMGQRDDKTPSNEDTGISQITSRIELLPDTKPDLEELPESTILFRELYTKNAKTGTAIRKFIGIRTNKTREQGFPSYYLYMTDFSAGRKEPLQTDIKIAGTERQLNDFLAKAIEENVKKGWDKIG